MGFFDKLKAGLKKTKHALFGPLDRLFSSYDKIDDDFYEELSDVLIMSDVGVETAEEICGLLRARVKEKKLRETSEARAELQEIMSGLIGDGGEMNLSSAPAVVLVIGGVFRLMTRSGFASVVLMLILEGLLLVGFLLDSSAYEGLFPEIMEQLSLFDRFYDFVYGIFDLGSVVYFLTVIGVFLFLSVQSLEKRRWSE
mgnify:CR=1 FL=1